MRLCSLAAVAIATSLAVSCVSPAHVVLETPPAKSAPEAERRAYYVDHAPTALRTINYVRSWSQPLSYIILEDGTRIDHPMELLPAVEPGSPTATAARRTEELDDSALWWTIGGTSAMAVGAFTPLAIPLVMLDENPNAPLSDAAALRGVGVTVAGLSVLVTGSIALAIGVHTAIAAQRERETAYLTYDGALRRRLGLPKRLEQPTLVGTAPSTDGDVSVREPEVPARLLPNDP